MKTRLMRLLLLSLSIIWIVVAPAQAQSFTEVGASAGIAREGHGVGAAWGDYDNDGDEDLFSTNTAGPNKLYQNDGNGTFTDVATRAGVDDPSSISVGLAWGDYDNDGDLDCYTTNARGGTNRLYLNNGDGTFTDVAHSAGVDFTGDSQFSSWGDYDSDGDVDLYMTNRGGSSQLYRNNNGGTFADVTSSAGMETGGFSRSAVWADYDDDGDIDLFLLFIDQTTASRLYRNNGDGTFTDVALSAGVDAIDVGGSAAWGDYDNDGDLDFFVANQGLPNRLYRNNGDGTFADVAPSLGMDDVGPAHSIGWGDYDNDGDLDFYVTNNGTANLFYRNNGEGTFTEVAAAFGMNNAGSGDGVGWADYDNDGDLDLYVANRDELGLLYRNEGTPNRWLHIKLQGTESNRSAIGAQVIAIAGGKQQRWDVDGGSGFCSQPSLPVEFGFGQTAMVDSLIIRWPSGILQTFTNLATNQRLAITEENPLITAVEEEEGATLPKAFSLSQNYPNPFNPQTTIHYQVPEEAEIRLIILDLAGQQVRTLAAGSHQPGQYSAMWDGADASGRPVASGVYVYRLEVKGRGVVETKRMALVR